MGIPEDLQALFNNATKPEEDIKTVLAQRIRTMFAELIPEPVLRKAVDDEIRWFMSSEPEPVYDQRALGGVVPPAKPTRLQTMIRSVLARRLERRVGVLLDEILPQNDNTETRAALEEMITRIAPDIWKGVMRDMIDSTVHTLRQNLDGGHARRPPRSGGPW